MSQLDSQTRVIGGKSFRVHKLPPLDAQDVLVDLGQTIAPALGKAVAGAAQVVGGQGVESLLDIDVEDPKISSAIAALAQGLDKKRLRDLVNTMASVSFCDDAPLAQVMPVVFRGNLPLMYQWLWFALVCNFGNFSEWVASVTKGATASAEAAQSQSTSGGHG